ncbi:MAG TPA: hypothetical protein VIV36_00185, partial [Gaiella sp.]
MDERRLLTRAAELAADWVESSPERPIPPGATIVELREALGGPLPDSGSPDLDVIEQLVRDGESGLTA